MPPERGAMSYRDLFLQGKTEMYLAWAALEDTLQRACEAGDRQDPTSKQLWLYQADKHAAALGRAAEAAVARMRKEGEVDANKS